MVSTITLASFVTFFAFFIVSFIVITPLHLLWNIVMREMTLITAWNNVKSFQIRSFHFTWKVATWFPRMVFKFLCWLPYVGACIEFIIFMYQHILYVSRLEAKEQAGE